ncbi:MAG: HNH endonuclease signature motif containing protein [Bdellovibrionota bacterium]
MNLQNLTNTELLNKTKSLALDERKTMIDLLVHLVEVDKRSLYLEQGYSSMFDFLVRALSFSESNASRRIKAIRALALQPKAEKLLRDGSLTISSLCIASVAIKTDSESIDRFKGASARKAEQIAAEYKPAPKKKLRDSVKPIGRKLEPIELALLDSTFNVERTDIKNLAPVEHEVKFRAGEEFTDKLEEVKKLLSGKYPAGITLEQVFTECMDTLLDKRCPVRRDKRRKAKIIKLKKPVATVSKPEKETTRNIPAKIRDEVYVRDNGQCTYESNGTVCGSSHDLEVDHVVPFGVSKSHEIDNLRLLCREHNMLMAKKAYGAEYVESAIEWKKSSTH